MKLKLRRAVFLLHRYVGLAVGLQLMVVGLTGSLLVFAPEIDHLLLNLQFGQIVPQQQQVSIQSVLDTVKAAYASRPDLKIVTIETLPVPEPYKVGLISPTQKWTDVLVNPYTGAIIGSLPRERTYTDFMVKLHHDLLAGEVGRIIVGIEAFLLFSLTITGILLWSGWRKLILGFKIKWQASKGRVSFDIHQVVGIIAAIFIGGNAFTGFCWNFPDFTKPIIYAVTLTPIPPNPVSKPIAGKSPLELSQILPIADAALPGAITTHTSLPQKPEGVFRIRKKFPQEMWDYGYSFVYLDQYTGEVVQLTNGLALSPAEGFLYSFAPLHFGRFGGLVTRILYVFVGLALTILVLTGFVIYGDRQWSKFKRKHN